MAAQIGNRLPDILRRLSVAGLGSVRALPTAEVAELVHVAYHPSADSSIDAMRASGEATGISWDNAGPAALAEDWDHMRHDSGSSVTWQMVEAPRGAVQSQVLRPLLEPAREIARKRVTLVYRPHTASEAARVADADVRTALGRATARKGEARAADTLDLRAARQAAAEEASGAGMSRFSLLVTATVLHSADLASGGRRRRRSRRCESAQPSPLLRRAVCVVRGRARGRDRAQQARCRSGCRSDVPMTATTRYDAPLSPRGYRGRGNGRVSYVEAPPEWRGTTVQVCGLFPWAVGASAPTVGVPVGPHLRTGATVCFDVINWFQRARFLLNPSMFVLGLPGLGKSTFVRRQITGLAAGGVMPLVLGDLKPDYADLDRCPRRAGHLARPRPWGPQRAGRRGTRRRRRSCSISPPPTVRELVRRCAQIDIAKKAVAASRRGARPPAQHGRGPGRHRARRADRRTTSRPFSRSRCATWPRAAARRNRRHCTIWSRCSRRVRPPFEP